MRVEIERIKKQITEICPHKEKRFIDVRLSSGLISLRNTLVYKCECCGKEIKVDFSSIPEKEQLALISNGVVPKEWESYVRPKKKNSSS